MYRVALLVLVIFVTSGCVATPDLWREANKTSMGAGQVVGAMSNKSPDDRKTAIVVEYGTNGRNWLNRKWYVAIPVDAGQSPSPPFRGPNGAGDDRALMAALSMVDAERLRLECPKPDASLIHQRDFVPASGGGRKPVSFLHGARTVAPRGYHATARSFDPVYLPYMEKESPADTRVVLVPEQLPVSDAARGQARVAATFLTPISLAVDVVATPIFIGWWVLGIGATP